MKVLVITENTKVIQAINEFCKPKNWYVFWYKLILKAIDNLTEIGPDIVVIDGRDFPRHWKIAMQHISVHKAKQSLKVILLVDSKFSENDRQKAEVLSVDSVLNLEKLLQKETSLEFALKLKA